MKTIDISNINDPQSREGVAIGEIVAVRNVRGKFIPGKVYANCISIGNMGGIEFDTPEEAARHTPYEK